MLHIHFGAGRLGLGLVAPFFRKPGGELYLLNRAVSGSNATGSTALDPGRRNELLRDHPGRHYFIQEPAGTGEDREVIRYDEFIPYGEDDIEAIVGSIAEKSGAKRAGIVVTASVLQPENYSAVVRALNALAKLKAGRGDEFGDIFLVACENTLTAHEIFEHGDLSSRIAPEMKEYVVPAHALVDRLCVGLEEDHSTPEPTVLVRAEGYGSLKLGLSPETEPLVALCEGSRIEFGRHIEVEKQIKSWLVNGTQWLIAVNAFREAEGDPELKLNQYLASSPDHMAFANAAMREIGEGVVLLLRDDPKYEAFAREVDVDRYVEGACTKFLERMTSTEDPISRILARFRAPTPDEANTIEAFAKRFADRIDGPIDAYEKAHGHLPPAASKGILSLYRLIATGHFIDTARVQHA